jgi:hypothetical protein
MECTMTEAIKSHTTTLTAARLRELLHYDPETGVFTWRVRRRSGVKGRVAPGDIAGSLQSKGRDRLRIGIDYKVYRAHRLAWLYMTGEWPSRLVDHKDLNGLNNRWDNLRLATHSQNTTNSRVRSDSISGLKGVSFHKIKNRYQARIKVDRKTIRLGYFNTAEEAHAAYCDAAEHHFGEFARFS